MRRALTIFVLFAFAAGPVAAFTATSADAHARISIRKSGGGTDRYAIEAPRDPHTGLATGK